MKKVVLSVVAAIAVSASSAFAADMPVKAVKVAPAPNPWDVAFGVAVVSDYNFRGISQSAKKPSFWAYLEPRYNINPNLQLYVGVGYESIKFPNDARAEVDWYAGIRPTFGAFAFDFGAWYYWYPGGNLKAGPTALVPTGNTAEKNASFWEVYGKVTWTVNDVVALGANLFYSPNWLNNGNPGTYGSLTAKLTAPSKWFAPDWGMYVSGELGNYWLGTTRTDAVWTPAINLPDYVTWNLGVAFTYKIATLDLRWYDTNLSKGNCNVLTGDPGATFSAANVSAINPGGFGSNWCSSTFVAKLAFDLTAANFK